MTLTAKPRILTGDTPTGRLHLGHWVGSVERRVALQDKYDCYFLLANMHAFTTRADKAADIRQDTIEIVKDWLAAGIDPNRSTIVLQTEIPAIAELTWFFAMLLSFNDVMGNPTLVHELETKGLADKYSFGFPMYTVGQCADILAFRPELIPVGEDQEPHIEMCRKAARKFNQLFCGIKSDAKDEDYPRLGGVFPEEPVQPLGGVYLAHDVVLDPEQEPSLALIAPLVVRDGDLLLLDLMRDRRGRDMARLALG